MSYEEVPLINNSNDILDDKDQVENHNNKNGGKLDGLFNEKKSIKQIFSTLRETYGLKFLLFLIVTQFFGKGLFCALIYCVTLPLFKYFGVNGIKYQILSTAAILSWAFKPLTGLISDNFIIFHYHKKYLMLFASTLGTLGSILCISSLIQINSITTEINIIVIGLSLMHFQISTNDLMVESKYTEIMKENPDTNTMIQSLVNAMTQFGYIIAIIIVGFLSDENNYIPIISLTLPLSLLPILFILLGWLPEIKSPHKFSIVRLIGESNVENQTNLKKSLIIIIPIVTSVGAILITISIIFIDNLLSIILTSILVLCLLIGGYFAFNSTIAKIIIYRFLACATWINISGAMDYFFIADEICNPGGPHFSYLDYVTYTGILSAFLAFIAAILYPILFSKWKYRNVIIFAALMCPFAGLFDIVIIKRWNLVIGIPDIIFFMMGRAILYNLIDMIGYIPLLAIISKNCDKGREATIYGYLAGISTISYALSSLVGSYLTLMFDINTVVGDGLMCNFDNLWLLVLIVHVIAPVLILIPSSFVLIEN